MGPNPLTTRGGDESAGGGRDGRCPDEARRGGVGEFAGEALTAREVGEGREAWKWF